MKIIHIEPIVEGTSSIYGKYKIPVLKGYIYDNKIMMVNSNEYFLRHCDALNYLERNKALVNKVEGNNPLTQDQLNNLYNEAVPVKRF